MKAVVTHDSVRYQVGEDPVTKSPVFQTAYKGDTVDLSDAEFKRLSDEDAHAPGGAVAKPASDDAKSAKAEADAVPESDKPK